MGGGLRSSHTGVHTHMCTQLEPPYGRGAHARPRGEAGDPPTDCMSELPAKPPIAPAASKAAGFPACGLTLTLNHSEACGLTLTPALHLTAQERECERCGRTALAQSRIGEMQALLSLRDAQLKALVELQRAAALRLGRAYALLVLEWHPTP